MEAGKYVTMLVIALGVQVMASGCKGGESLSELFNSAGSATASLFGGGSGDGSGSGSGGDTNSNSQSDTDSGSGVGGGSGSGGGGTVIADAAVVHQPEPASLALFGGGLASLAMYRRRSAKRSRNTQHARA